MTKTIRTEQYQRGFMGVLCKWAFILYNLFMLGWLAVYWLGDGIPTRETFDMSNMGSNVGKLIASSYILRLWFVGGMALGFLTYMTRGKKVITEETQE